LIFLLSKSKKMNFNNVYIILVEPESPGNIGSVARAMKNMGLSQLRLVNPCDTDTKELRMLAHRSKDIVRNAKHFDSLKAALADINVSIGTTMRRRSIKFPNYTPEDIAEIINRLDDETRAAFVFGRERTGLYTEELNLCQHHSTIPTATMKPAINLAQSVMIYSYTLFRKARANNRKVHYKPASHEAVEKLYDHLSDALHRVNFMPRDDMQTFISRFRRILGRALPEYQDLQILHKIIQVLLKEKESSGKKGD
jgi:TrmH family RNA methyltransferase